MTGHLLGGADESAACALAIRDSVIAHINLKIRAKNATLIIRRMLQKKKVRVVLNNSFGFGGHNATLVATAFED
jgi:3-oxoacyl-[acyl-carrier-protein] synthase II